MLQYKSDTHLGAIVLLPLRFNFARVNQGDPRDPGPPLAIEFALPAV